MFYIEELKQQHVEAAKGVIRNVWKEYFGDDSRTDVRTHFDSHQSLRNLDDGASLFVSNGGAFLVLMADSDVIGTGGFIRLADECCEFKHIFLLKAFRRRGLGELLVSSLINRARKKEYKKVVLGTSKRFREAHSLYQKLGFRDSDKLDPQNLTDYFELSL